MEVREPPLPGANLPTPLIATDPVASTIPSSTVSTGLFWVGFSICNLHSAICNLIVYCDRKAPLIMRKIAVDDRGKACGKH
jgi:hypothetical protein